MTKTLDIKLGIYLILSFIIFTIIGTVSHELGHYTVAKILGHEASINYAHTRHVDVNSRTQLDQIYAKYSNEIPKGDYPEKQQYEIIVSKMIHDSFIVEKKQRNILYKIMNKNYDIIAKKYSKTKILSKI